MNWWSNIEVNPDDAEITEINKLEMSLGEVPDAVKQIRKLISGFEVCHFKYKEHIKKVKISIVSLKPTTDPESIGTHHIRKGEDAWKGDETGRSFSAQMYLWALSEWLGDQRPRPATGEDYDKLQKQIAGWLGEKDPDKERLVRLLLARLLWDWKSIESLQQGKDLKELERQICRMDICHYSFPVHLDGILQSIGVKKPMDSFEGCGSFNEDIKMFIEKEFLKVNSWRKSLAESGSSDREELIRIWLLACLAKTLKEQIGLKEPIDELAVC